jgi:hypothetical protein
MDEITSTQMKKLSIPNAPNKNKKENIQNLKFFYLKKRNLPHGNFQLVLNISLRFENSQKKT